MEEAVEGVCLASALDLYRILQKMNPHGEDATAEYACKAIGIVQWTCEVLHISTLSAHV